MSDNIKYTQEIPDVLGPQLNPKITRKSSIPHYGKRIHRKILEKQDYDILTTSQIVISYIVLFVAFILSVIFIHIYYDYPDTFSLFLVITFGLIGIMYSYTQYKINIIKVDVVYILGRILLYLITLLLFLISIGAINDKLLPVINKNVWPGFILLLGFLLMASFEHYKDIIGSYKYMYTTMIIIFSFIWLIFIQINENRNKKICMC